MPTAQLLPNYCYVALHSTDNAFGYHNIIIKAMATPGPRQSDEVI